jgi:hypothetical protein
LFIGCGPSVAPVGEIDAAMADVSATLLARLELSQLHRCDGRALDEMLRAEHAVTVPQPSAAGDPVHDSTHSTHSADPAAEARVEARLRRLGYIE